MNQSAFQFIGPVDIVIPTVTLNGSQCAMDLFTLRPSFPRKESPVSTKPRPVSLEDPCLLFSHHSTWNTNISVSILPP